MTDDGVIRMFCGCARDDVLAEMGHTTPGCTIQAEADEQDRRFGVPPDEPQEW
jgi:hypothetical protein